MLRQIHVDNHIHISNNWILVKAKCTYLDYFLSDFYKSIFITGQLKGNLDMYTIDAKYILFKVVNVTEYLSQNHKTSLI